MRRLAIIPLLAVLLTSEAHAQRQMEKLGRGLIAMVRADGKVYLSWRLLGTDAEKITFNVYRTTAGGAAEKLNENPIVTSTNFIDEKPPLAGGVRYHVRPMIDASEGEPSAPFVIPPSGSARQYIEIPLKIPAGYAPGDASVGDLDGDGEYEIVIHMNGRGRDNSFAGLTDPPILQAYKFDGTPLWTINLGRNIREGAHYTQFMVYDLDGDGRAEVAMKTGDGTMDARGNVIGDSSKDWRNDRGYILAGPEYLTVFNGLTGEAMATTDFIPPRHPKLNPTTDELKEMWGDGYG